jgi:hypothetical protein
VAELISLHQIVTREKKGGPRIVIPANSRFNPEDYPWISEAEWRAMMQGEHQIVRTPDDPAYAVPPVSAQRAAADQPVTEGRSPRTDVGDRAPAVTRDGVTRPVAVKEDEDEDGEEAAAADDAARRERVAAQRNRGGRRGTRRTATAEEDDDDL